MDADDASDVAGSDDFSDAADSDDASGTTGDSATDPVPVPTVGEAVIDCLLDRGIETVFGIPGKQTLPLNRAVADRDARFVVARHETAVTHQAWGYAETSEPGEMAATVVVPGPGDMNAMNGLKNALNDAVPMVHLAVETERHVRGGDGIHETPPETYDTVVKENVLVESAAGAVAAVADAVRTARAHPQGPVRVGIPKDVLASRTPQAIPPEPDASDPPGAPASAIRRAADLLSRADEPVLLAGGGVRRSGASDVLRSLAERLDAPVVTTYKGKGTIPETHPLSAGVLCGGSSTELRELLAGADVGLVVGSDLDAVATATWSVDLPDELIHVTLDADDIGFGYETELGVVADADRFMGALLDRLPEADPGPSDCDAGTTRAAAVREADRERFVSVAADRDGDAPLRSVEVVSEVRDAIPDESVVTVDAGGFRLWTLVSFPAMGPRSYVNPGSWATMGTGVPSAIGAALANPDREVVALTGDGGLLMCVHELHTLATEGLDVTVVALNNDDYAIISEEAERSYGFDPGTYGWADHGLDLVAVANGMGVRAERVREVDAVGDAVAAALAADGPALVEVVTDPAEPQASEWMTRDR
ncbi:thiamine pyrophosphate-binding protein [Halorubrum sp. DTA98]|uniref:thiamine pyrophosphate-binding protein n=1 Tax=Halorubrum sp. DTA98 TaxID=3402163 RepID=UPI003AB04D82